MKRILSLVVGCLLSLLGITARAQSVQVATLTSGDDVKIFMGHKALNDAATAAIDGDVITLSAGVFDSPSKTITKKLTIRGAGAGFENYVPYVEPTLITGSCQFDSDIFCKDIRFTGSVTTNVSASKGSATFLRCYIERYNASTNTAIVTANLTQCQVDKAISAYYMTLHAVNSVLTILYSDCVNYHAVLENCDLTYQASTIPSYTAPLNSVCTNCIITSTVRAPEADPSTTYYNNLFYGCDQSVAELNQNGTNKVLDGVETVFSEEGFYELLEEYKSFKGNDGRQVGIHGGNLGFNVTPKAPKITSFSISPETAPDGSLSIGVKVEDAQ